MLKKLVAPELLPPNNLWKANTPASRRAILPTKRAFMTRRPRLPRRIGIKANNLIPAAAIRGSAIFFILARPGNKSYGVKINFGSGDISNLKQVKWKFRNFTLIDKF